MLVVLGIADFDIAIDVFLVAVLLVVLSFFCCSPLTVGGEECWEQR